MANRVLTRLTVAPGPDGVLDLATELPHALNGEGPALAPLPSGPAEYLETVLELLRPDDPSAPLESDDVAVVVTTSGSMGHPRGVLLSGAALLSSARAANTRLGGPARWVLALPVHHVAGLQVLVRAHLSGIHPIPLNSVGGAGHFSAREFANATRIARAMCDVDGAPLRTALVPTQLARVLELGGAAADCLTAYDSILIGGAAAPTGLVKLAKESGAPIVTTYGMTETAGGCVYDGQPLVGVSVGITAPDDIGVGRIEIRGTCVAGGYRLESELTAASFGDGFLRTSDLGYLDSDGGLVVVGRVDDVVQVGGINVSVAAVETVIQSALSVAEAAVVAIDDYEWGSRVCAFVVPNRTAPAAVDGFVAAVIELVTEALGFEARPKDVTVLDRLPTLPTGKIDRAALRRQASLAARG